MPAIYSIRRTSGRDMAQVRRPVKPEPEPEPLPKAKRRKPEANDADVETSDG